MKAILWTAYGDFDVLQPAEVDKPAPKADEVLVKIAATTATVGDCRLRGFRVPPGFWLLTRLVFGLVKPRKTIPGTDFSGEIEAVGENVRAFQKGDRVCGTTGMKLGANAEYVCIAEEGPLVKIPDTVSYENAAAVIFGGLTAVDFLKHKTTIRNGHKVLINGASGAVGTAAVQLAKYCGAEVTGVCGPSNRGLVKSIGADRAIDYTREDFIQNGERYDVILDAVGNLSWAKCENSLAPQGKPVLLNTGLWGNLRAIWNKKLICGVAGESKGDLMFLIDLVDSGHIAPVIDTVYPLEKTAEAHRYIDQGHKRGSVVLRVG